MYNASLEANKSRFTEANGGRRCRWRVSFSLLLAALLLLFALSSDVQARSAPFVAGAQSRWPIATAGTGFAQDNGLRFEHLTIDDGLSQSVVLDIIQDSKGFLWLATQDGLNRYDGYEFQTLKHDPDDENSLSDSPAAAIQEGILDDVGRFATEPRQTDDIALVILVRSRVPATDHGKKR